MQVLIDSSPLLGKSGARGIGTYTRNLISYLRLLAKNKHLDLQVDALHELGDQASAATVRHDLLHYPYFDFFFNTLSGSHSAPFVVTVHDVVPLIYPQHFPPGIKGKLRFQIQKRNLKNAQLIITDSQSSAEGIVEHLDIALSKIRVVPLAGNPEITALSDSQARRYAQQLDLPNNYFVYVGDINYNKNIPTLLLALTQLPSHVHLCVVSRSFNNTQIEEGQVIAKTIEDNALAERVHVLDIPPDEPSKLAGVLQRSIALVQPSLWEGFGLPVLEAMQAGTVVVSSNAGSLPEVAEPAAIMVDPNLMGLVQGMEEALSIRGEDRQQLIEKGKKQANKFTWEETARKTYQVYEEALVLAAKK